MDANAIQLSSEEAYFFTIPSIFNANPDGCRHELSSTVPRTLWGKGDISVTCYKCNVGNYASVKPNEQSYEKRMGKTFHTNAPSLALKVI